MRPSAAQSLSQATLFTLGLLYGACFGLLSCAESESDVDNGGGVSSSPRNLRESGAEIVENPAPMLTTTTDTPLPAGNSMRHDSPVPAGSSDGALIGFPRVARALERGQLQEARILLTQADLKRNEARLLRARLLLRQGEAVAALREIELARAEEPNSGRVYGTAAELYIAMGRMEDAEDEIRRGLAVDGDNAAMERARGIYFLQLPGAVMTARIHLMRALELAPDLAFTARPLAEAHRRAGRTFLRDRNHLEAIRAARAALELYPQEFEFRQLHADALLAAGSLRHAVEIFEELLAEGHPVDDDLAMASWRAGMGELIRRNRDQAMELFARARELGMNSEALGTAANLLGQESMARVGRGIEAYQAEQIDAARELFAEAVYLDPNNLAALNHLAVTHSRLGMMDLAIEGWTHVLSIFEENGGTPPEPIHLNLVNAFLERGELERVTRLLEHYEPDAAATLSSEPSSGELEECLVDLRESYRSASLQRAE